MSLVAYNNCGGHANATVLLANANVAPLCLTIINQRKSTAALRVKPQCTDMPLHRVYGSKGPVLGKKKPKKSARSSSLNTVLDLQCLHVLSKRAMPASGDPYLLELTFDAVRAHNLTCGFLHCQEGQHNIS